MANLEYLPDEILLQICRYLHPYDILYSFTNLNQRLTRTITDFIQHIHLSTVCSYEKYIDLLEHIFPIIWTNIQSLTINNCQVPCLTTIFLRIFKEHLPINLKKLTLLDINTYEIYQFLTQSMTKTTIEELIIECTDRDFLKQQEIFGYKIAQILFFHHPTLKSIELRGDIIFDLSHLSFLSLSNSDDSDETHSISRSYLLQRLTLPLRSLSSLHLLLIYQPYLRYLNVHIGDAKTTYDYTITPFPPLINLEEFHFRSDDLAIKFENLSELLIYFPNLKTLSLHLTTECQAFFDGDILQTFLSSIENFHFSIARFSSPTYEEQSLSTFSTPFWLENKHWYTQAYWHIENAYVDSDYFHIYSIPYPFVNFDIYKCTQENCFYKDQISFYPNVKRMDLSETSDINILSFLKRCSNVETIYLNNIYDDEENYGTDEEEDITDFIDENLENSINNHSNQTSLTMLPYVHHINLVALPENDLKFFEQLILVTPNINRLSICFDDLLEILNNSSNQSTNILRRQIKQIEIHFDYHWSTSDIRRDIQKILRLFSNLKSLTISIHSSQKYLIKTIREIFIQSLKYHSQLLCINIDDLSTHDMKFLSKEISIKTWFQTSVHLELNSSSITIWL